jgi:hypothetical protein
LTESQQWAVASFEGIIARATGYNEQWSLLATHTHNDGGQTWEYRAEGIPDIDLIVDHIIHELTDAVLLSEWHSTSADDFTFGSMRRDRPERLEPPKPTEETAPPEIKETAP